MGFCRGATLLLLFLGTVVARAGAAPLRVGIDLNGEPMTLVDAKGVPAGFAVDLVNAIAQEMHFEMVFVARSWPEMLEDFKAGRTDAIANIAYTQERAEFIEFVDPHVVMAGAIFVRRGDTSIKSPVDLRGRRIAVKPGGSPHEYLRAHGWAQNIVPTVALRDSLRALAEGRADAAIDARIIGLKDIRDERLEGVEVSDVVLPDFALRLHLGFHHGDTAHALLCNEGLARLHANGTYDRIYEKWIGPLEPGQLRWRDVQPFLPAAVMLLAAIGGIVYWQRRLLRERARQAAALRQSEERLMLVLEGSEDGFWDWDLRTGHIERSERWAAMLGYELREIAPSLDGCLALVHPADRDAYAAYQSERQAGRSSRHDIEFRMQAKSGEWRWILDRGKIVARAPDGPPARMAGTHSDITDLKRTQEALARHEAQFRFIYEHAPIGLSWLRQDHPETRLVNPAHERITGVTRACSLDTANYVTATHPGDRDRQRQLQEQLNRGEIDHFSMEKRYVHPDGSVVRAMLTMHVYRDPATGEAQELSTLVDITELKHAEEEREKLRLKMLEAQKLESLGVLAGGIAHDFNNLLTVILANATLARMDSGRAGGHQEELANIEAASQRAADLCRQMLAYAGQGAFAVERVDLGRLVQDTAQLLQVSISKKAQLTVALAADLPPIEADASQLQQVVMNLVINASDALEDQTGEIRLRTWRGRPLPVPDGVVYSFDLPGDDCACLEVADTGFGMDAGTLARIFDPFFTTKFTGRGLGLAAVLGIVRACRGALTVASAQRRGTTFRLYLPAAAPRASEPPVAGAPAAGVSAPPHPAAPAGALGTILIADDEPVVLSSTSSLLRRKGFTTVLAADGLEAVRHFRANPDGFAAVLLDLTMPGLDGAEVLREIRQVNPAARVLVMSGFSEHDVRKRLGDLHPVAILHKPFTLEVLLSRLREVMGS